MMRLCAAGMALFFMYCSADAGDRGAERASMIAFVHSDAGHEHEDEEKGNREIWLMDTDGGRLTRLTDNPANDTEPTWAPDASALAFATDRDGNSEIYTIRLETGALTRLTNDPAEDFQPAWSPDGKSIAFVSTRTEKNYDIYVMNADGSNVRRITSGKGMEAFPAWSPDGRMLAYTQTSPEDKKGQNWDLYVVEAKAGAAPRQITSTKFLEFAPAWSPDGKNLMYMSFRDGNEDLYMAAAQGGGERRLTEDPAAEDHPSISPDGTSVVFMCVTIAGDRETHAIVRMDLATKARKTLTGKDGSAFHPRWSPAPVNLDALRRYAVPPPAK